ncbi:MAG: RagB/SusD family nutrient uptake outer membrane protein [Ferruginibacter sp.]|nr:RagB/SusD family nutrient uptake outer membrane protein [Ferruginibacter sp.]
MRNKILSTIFLGLMLAGTSCKKLDTKPTQSIDEASALNTSADVQVALVGAYSDLIDADLYGGLAFVAPDLLGDFNEISWSGTFQGLTQINNKNIPVDNIFVRDTWLAAYRTINGVNNVLSAMSVVTANQAARIEGEASFIRGSVYFDLVRLYAKAYNDGTPGSNPGVPLVLTPTRGITDADQVPRSTVADVYAQVIADLTNAEAKLPASNTFYATKGAAAAMLARVYLQKGDYANAAQAANRVIASGLYSLKTNYADAFPAVVGSPAYIPNTTEDIFAMQVNATQGSNSFNTYYSSNGRGDISINDSHLDLYEANDERRDLFYDDGGSIYSGKNENTYGNVRVIRLAEMYLIRAEANFRLLPAAPIGGVTPLADINRIRERANLLPLALVTLPIILKERKLELAFEGFTLHDAKRLQQNVGTIAWNSPKLVYPIPDREVRVNANLEQNPGY